MAILKFVLVLVSAAISYLLIGYLIDGRSIGIERFLTTDLVVKSIFVGLFIAGISILIFNQKPPLK